MSSSESIISRVFSAHTPIHPRYPNSFRLSVVFGTFKKSQSLDSINNTDSRDLYGLLSLRRLTSSSMALAPTPMQAENDMAAVWRSVDAPRSTFKVDNTKFFVPAGPMVDDRFWMVLTNGDIGIVSKDGFQVEDSRVDYRIKKKERKKGFTFHCGNLTVDYHPSKSLRRCVIGHGSSAEQRVITRLKTDCQYAAGKIAKCMASMLWHRVQSQGSINTRSQTDVADDLGKAAQALGELVGFAGRFIEVMRRQYQGGGREGNMPLAYKKALVLLDSAKWYRAHRATNSIQCLKKAFRQSVDRTACPATQYRSENFIQSNLLGMLGWRLAPRSMGSQRDVLLDVLTTLGVLGTVDWDDFQAWAVTAKMEQTEITVKIVREADFSIRPQQKMIRFLQHRPLGALDRTEVRLAGQESRWEGSIHPSHLRMLKALPWVKHFEANGRAILRLVALDG